MNETTFSELRTQLHQVRGPQPVQSSPWQASQKHSQVFFVREDLTGGYKARKFRSLLPWIVEQNPSWVRLFGSSHSAFITELSLGLAQRGIACRYQLQGREGPPKGFGLLNRLILGSSFCDRACENGRAGDVHSSQPPLDIAEGGECPASLPGVLEMGYGLAQSIIEKAWLPQEIYIDAGTGLSAVGLLLALSQLRLPARLKIVSMSGQTQFQIQAKVQEFGQYLRWRPEKIADFEVLSPPTARSFGSTNHTVFKEIQRMAQDEGILVDPVYSAKLTLTFEQVHQPQIPALVYIGGGARELLCFQDQLAGFLNLSKPMSKPLDKRRS